MESPDSDSGYSYHHPTRRAGFGTGDGPDRHAGCPTLRASCTFGLHLSFTASLWAVRIGFGSSVLGLPSREVLLFDEHRSFQVIFSYLRLGVPGDQYPSRFSAQIRFDHFDRTFPNRVTE